MRDRRSGSWPNRPNDRVPRSIAASWNAIHQRLQRLSDSHFEILKLLERRERGLHELRLPTMSLKRADQVVNLRKCVVQRGLRRLGLLQNGIEAAAMVVIGIVIRRC